MRTTKFERKRCLEYDHLFYMGNKYNQAKEVYHQILIPLFRGSLSFYQS